MQRRYVESQGGGSNLREELPGSHLLERLGVPKDVPHSVWYLASEHGSYLTRVVLRVESGVRR